MTYTPIPYGTDNWNVPLDAALTDQDGRITQNTTDIATANGNISGKVSKSGDTMTGTLNIQSPNATNSALTAIVTGDAQARLNVTSAGVVQWGPGTGATDTTLNRSGVNALSTAGFFAMGSGQSGGDFTVFTGNAKALKAGTVGGGLAITEGTNGRLGVATLVAGTATVANTSVTANTRIMLSRQTAGGTLGHLSVTRTAGTSFVITASGGADTSTIAWELIEPN